jgi:condensin complex subunit 2
MSLRYSLADAETSASKPKREKKEAFRIDFFSPLDLKEVSEQLFAPATRGAGINLPGTSSSTSKSKKGAKKKKDKEKRDDHRLPDDMHFSSKQLVTLFLKPSFAVSRCSWCCRRTLISVSLQLKMRGRRVRYDEHGDGEVDENFWAQAAADQAAGRHEEDQADESELSLG